MTNKCPGANPYTGEVGGRERGPGHQEANELRDRVEKADQRIAELERERDEARKALIWYASACIDQDEPAEIRAAYNEAEAAMNRFCDGYDAALAAGEKK